MNEFLGVDNIAFYIGNFAIYWYGIIMCLAIIVAIVVAVVFCKIRGVSTDIPIDIALAVVPIGILSARLFAVLFDKDLSILQYFNFRTGGMSIIGAIIGGAVGLVLYCIIKKVKNPFLYFDILAVVLILAQAIGRWGNFFNNEVYGQVIESTSIFARFPYAVEVNGVYYQALFLYESVLDLIGFGVLAVMFLMQSDSGYVTASYLIYYGTIRTLLEPLRQQQYILRLWGLPVSRVMSIIMIVAGLALLIYKLVMKHKGKGLKESNGKKGK